MAIYRIFPEKDTFIYTEAIKGNAGLDEIIEIGGYLVSEVGQTSRALLKFNDTDVANVVSNIIGSNNYSASIHLSLATAYEVPTEYSIKAYPVYEPWVQGIGKFGDSPVDESGVSWTYRLGKQDGRWTLRSNTVNMPAGVTGSYNATYSGGGGNWYTGSAGINFESTQLQELNSNNDIHINVTNGVKAHVAGTIVNNGFILKLTDDLEFNTSSSIRLKYFSGNTNTIYPPYLEFGWNDTVYNSNLTELSTSNATINIKNNKGEYVDNGKQRFRIHARPKYPTRTFSTGSVYLTNYKLPANSYWGLRDEHTEEMVVDFNTAFTKISADNNGSYFDVYMEGLQPERYYRILVKSTLDGSTTVVDNGNVFKIVRNG